MCICERVDGAAGSQRTPIGLVLRPSEVDIPAGDMAEFVLVDIAGWRAEPPDIEKQFSQFDSRLTGRMAKRLSQLRSRLG